MSEALVALGSNLGDSPRILHEAMDAIAGMAREHFRRSSLWRTTPVDCPPGSPSFLNAAVAFAPQPSETPESLLQELQRLERQFGRQPKRLANEPRVLDLDLIAFGNQTRNSPTLILPHPRAHLRRFVLAPFAEVAPDFRLPGRNWTIAELLAALESGEEVTLFEKAGAPRLGRKS
jgi:2-amino-4-hydroxy-6-hydroxymethyldihydropteridine diphosphokinase